MIELSCLNAFLTITSLASSFLDLDGYPITSDGLCTGFCVDFFQVAEALLVVGLEAFVVVVVVVVVVVLEVVWEVVDGVVFDVDFSVLNLVVEGCVVDVDLTEGIDSAAETSSKLTLTTVGTPEPSLSFGHESSSG